MSIAYLESSPETSGLRTASQKHATTMTLPEHLHLDLETQKLHSPERF
jgi:hypothetical protein